MSRLNFSRKAFTLVELLIVITIIGILAVALVPRLLSGPERARDAQRKTDLQEIATALALYADDNNGAYPATSCTGTAAFVTALNPYLTSMPKDPKSSWGPITTSLNCSGAAEGGYMFVRTSTGFVLVSRLETTTTTTVGAYNASAGGTLATNLVTATAAGKSTNTLMTDIAGAACSTSAPCNAAAVTAVAYLISR